MRVERAPAYTIIKTEASIVRNVRAIRQYFLEDPDRLVMAAVIMAVVAIVILGYVE